MRWMEAGHFQISSQLIYTKQRAATFASNLYLSSAPLDTK